MIEVDEQGFVRDIKAAIDAINQENKSLREKVKEIIELPYGTQHEVEIENYINSFTNGQVDVREELYNIAMANEIFNSFGVKNESAQEKRHKELVEALMNRMEGVFKMYDVNEIENVQPVIPTVDQPVEVQTPQLEVINPEVPVAEVPASEPVATLDAPEMFTPMANPSTFTEPPVYGEVPTMDVAPVAPVVENTLEGLTAPVEAQPQSEVPSFQDFINSQEFGTQEPVQEVNSDVPSFQDFINNTDFSDINASLLPPEDNTPVEEPVAEQQFDDFVKEMPVEQVTETYEEPVSEPVAEEVPEETAEETYEEPVSEDMDAKVREISERYDNLKRLEIRVYKNTKELDELEAKRAQIQKEIDDDQEEINSLKLAA